MHKDEHHCSDRNGQHAQAACPQLACSRSLKPDFADDIARNHRAYAQRQACNRAKGRKQHGAQADTAEPLRQIGNEIQRQCVNRIYLRMMQMHEHTDHYRRQSHGNYYQCGSTAADSCSFGIARRKQCLHIGLRRNNAHNHRTEADKTVLHAASEKAEPRICCEALCHALPMSHIGVGQKAADENAGENQHNLKNPGHSAAAKATEKHQQ